MLTKKTKNFFLAWLIPLLVIICWQIAVTQQWIETRLIPSPYAILKDGITLWQTGDLQRNIAISLYRATSGLLLGGLLGFFFAIATSLSKVWNLLFDSTIQMIRNIPHLALIPLIIVWLGIGESAKIVLVAIGVFFPIYINTYHGVRSVDPKLIEMGHSYDLTQIRLFSKIIFPGALPTILQGVRYALGVMWTTLIVSETISASSGIGYMETNAQQFLDMQTIFLAIIIYALLGKLSDSIAQLLEAIFLEWRHVEEVQTNVR